MCQAGDVASPRQHLPHLLVQPCPSYPMPSISSTPPPPANLCPPTVTFSPSPPSSFLDLQVTASDKDNLARRRTV